MNELSQKLYKALGSQPIASARKSNSNYPSCSSQFITAPDGRNQLIGDCNRAQWYRRMDVAPTEGDNQNWNMAAIQGDYLHEMVCDLLVRNQVKMGLQELGKETNIYDPETKMSGRCDYLAWDVDNQEPIGIEIKSVGDWKSKKCLEEPALEHVLQSMMYLDYFQQTVPKDQAQFTKWYIWYIARGEGWHLKGAKQLSPFMQLWDFYLTLDEDGIPTIHTPTGPKRYPQIAVTEVKNRFKLLNKAVEENEIPDRDCQLQYSEEVIAGMFKAGLIELKGQQKTIADWLDNGAQKGKLGLQIGDAQCRFCAWRSLCWDLPCTPSKPQHNLPRRETKEQEASSNEISIL